MYFIVGLFSRTLALNDVIMICPFALISISFINEQDVCVAARFCIKQTKTIFHCYVSIVLNVNR